MPTVAPGVHTLPAPTWVQSDNNLFPKWRRYLEWHAAQYGEDEVRRLRNVLQGHDENIEYYLAEFQQQKTWADEASQELKALEAGGYTDDEITRQYEAVITSPHVIGTRIDTWGNLVVLIDPLVEGAQDRDFGLYELDFHSYTTGYFDFLGLHPETEYVISQYVGRLSGNTMGHPTAKSMYLGMEEDAKDALGRFNVEAAINSIVDRVAAYTVNVRGSLPLKADDRAEQIPWWGMTVPDPLRAMKRLVETVHGNTERRIAELKEAVRSYQNNMKYYQETLRERRKTRRDAAADLAKAEAAQQKQTVSDEEATRSLAYITNLAGVIGIRFTESGVPVLHVRNSFVQNGKRYDLGDFELMLETERASFGTVLNVKRTRVPLGGTYEAGWHSSSNAFCFGNRNEEILSAFYAGDFFHAVNVALGTMNTVQQGTFYLDEFAEIAMDAVWVNRRRKRPRRKRHEAAKAAPQTAPAPRTGVLRKEQVVRALGRAAIKAVTGQK